MSLKPSILPLLAASIGLSLLAGCHSSKEAVSPSRLASRNALKVNPPVYVLNQVKVEELKQAQIHGRKFTTEDIESITVLKQSPELLAKYGPQAQNGVVLITTKQATK
ncbi:hypothetical protein [Larkinella soli]|uniref:hypothetical protein n=1 Tax=Larkinella soli TaxID=1770527 RepID=UPI000FFB48A6|nr:hypothetical protein [Larkinella soli]